MIWKLIAGIFVITGTWGIGIAKCQDMKEKLFHEKEQEKILIYIEREIDYLNCPVAEIIENIKGKIKEPYKLLFKNIEARIREDKGESINTIWVECTDEMIRSKHSKKEWFKYLYRIGNCLGCEENRLQISMLNLIKEELSEDIEMNKSTLQEKEKLIKTLSLLAGIFWVVLLI